MSLRIFKKLKIEDEIVAYILYVYDLDKWAAEMLPLSRFYTPIEIRKYRETYALDKVFCYLKGVPVYLLIRGVPYSLELEKVKSQLVMKGYSASEINAKINSIYTNSVFRRPAFVGKDLVFLLLAIIIAILASVLAMFMWHTSEVARITAEFNATTTDNSTLSTIINIVGGILLFR